MPRGPRATRTRGRRSARAHRRRFNMPRGGGYRGRRRVADTGQEGQLRDDTEHGVRARRSTGRAHPFSLRPARHAVRLCRPTAADGGHRLDAVSRRTLGPVTLRGWTVTDVLRHLVWVDDIVHRVWSGDESLADGFDPRPRPMRSCRPIGSCPMRRSTTRYLASTAAMSEELQATGPERFGQPSLSPVGSVPWWLSAVHIGWDSAVHERDILVPLGRPVVASSDRRCPAWPMRS